MEPPASISVPLNKAFMDIYIKGGDAKQRLRLLRDIPPLSDRLFAIPPLKMLCIDVLVCADLKRYSLHSLQKGKFPARAKRKIAQVAPELVDDMNRIKLCRGYSPGYRHGIPRYGFEPHITVYPTINVFRKKRTRSGRSSSPELEQQCVACWIRDLEPSALSSAS
jgi:hypothetical protein